jgi:hypothetical protein
MEDAGFVLIEDWQPGWYILWEGTIEEIKTIIGLTLSSVKTVNGLAVASMKTWVGLP